MPFATARMLLLALASLDTGDLLRMMPADPAEAAHFRAVVGAVRTGEAESLQETLDAFLATDEWQEVRWHGTHLASFGDPAVKAVANVIRLDRGNLDEETIRDCFQWLLRQFPEHPRTIATAIGGLRSEARGVRYECTFFLGQHKIYGAHQALRQVLEDLELGELTRYTAAKSLAELGEPDVVRTLYEAAGSDAYMCRHMAHLGFIAIAGKSPDDFGDYQYGEGTSIIGGNEYSTPFEAITLADRRAGRYRALADFCAWLKAERPDLYKHLTHSLP